MVSVAVGGGVCFLYVTAASYCTVALNQVDLARNVRRRLLRLQRRRRLVESARVGFEWLWRRGACVGGRRRVLGVVCRTSLSDWAVVFEMNKVETVCTGVSVFYNGNVCN